MPTINERVAALRALLTQHNLDAWLINGTDPHQSEYVAERWQSREWMSGFTGSAGSVLVTATEALLWADSRYFIQAEAELAGSEFSLVKIDTPGFPDLYGYLNEHFGDGGRIGIAGETVTINAQALFDRSTERLISLVAMEDLLDEV